MQTTHNRSQYDDDKELTRQIRENTLKKLYRKSAEERAVKVADQHNLPYLDLSLIHIGAEAVNAVPENIAKAANLAVIYKIGKKCRIAVTDPVNPETVQALKQLESQGINYELNVVSPESLLKAWVQYDNKNFINAVQEQSVSIKTEDLTNFEQGITDLIKLKQRISEINTTEVFGIIIAGAVKVKASDIHIEPEKNEIRIRYRIDGVLQDIIKLPKDIHRTIISRVKMLAKMKLNITSTPQDGNFDVSMENNNLNIRVSILPTPHGESVVMRVLSENNEGLQLEQLGFHQYYLEKIQEQIMKPTGMILTTGPTGSGKTTTLYAFLQKLNSPGIKIITLENPIEYKIEGVTQTQVRPEDGFSFVDALQAVVRQDPDVIMVGEMRNKETAETAIQAALTGHFVLSTLHTNNAAGAIPRLLHLGVKSTLIAPALNTVIAQRLVRRLCQHCREEYTPAQTTINKIQQIINNIPKKERLAIPSNLNKLYRSRGCAKCNFIGYSGRIGIYEIFTMTPNIQNIILDSTSVADMNKAARQDGMLTLEEDGLLKALEGFTSLEEIRRATGETFMQ